MDGKKIKQTVNLVLTVIMYLFLVLCVGFVGVVLFSDKDDDGTTEVFGYQLRLVVSPSMEKCELTDVSDYEIKSIPVNSLVFIQMVPEDKEEAKAWYDELEVGDVLTIKYVYTRQVAITHRITSKTPNASGGYDLVLAGDNKNSEEGQLVQKIDTSLDNSTNYVVGKVTSQSVLIGFILSLLKSPLGLVLIVIVPCAILIIYEIIKIFNVLSKERRDHDAMKVKAKEDEIEALKQRLKELENKNDALPAENAEKGEAD